MRRWIQALLVLAISVLMSCSGPSSHDAEATVAALADIEQKLAKAWVDGDRETISAILAPDWAVVDIAGRVLTKGQVLEEAFGTGDRKIEAMRIDDVKVRPFGEIAIVTGRTVAAGSYQGKRSEVELRFTDVFARREGVWQVVASQGTAVTQ